MRKGLIGIVLLICFLFASFANKPLASAKSAESEDINIAENFGKGVVNAAFGALAECVTSPGREVANDGGVLGFFKGIYNIPGNALERTTVGVATVYKCPTENTRLTWPWSLKKPLDN